MRGIKEERKAMAVTIDAWHKRLGHASDIKLSRVNFLKEVSSSFRNKVCDSCNKAKLTRLPFPISSIKTTNCFELIHCDVWGKYRKPSLTGANYFLTIVDDYSRAVWVYLLKHKHEASTCLIDFYNMVKTQFEKGIKRIRCDNGGEFVSNNMNEFYREHGIVLETSCPRTPQQNGVVERKHRHLLEIARALRFEANLPTTFWGECILTATYIVNRLPSKVINDKTPYEILFERYPEYDHMRVFGCLAYYKNTETNGDKFEPRGKPGVFLGYPPGKKGYKIYDLEKGKMVMTRDVKFIEDSFPFQKIENFEQEIFEYLRPTPQYDEAYEVVENVETRGDSMQSDEENQMHSMEEQLEEIVEEEQNMESNTNNNDVHMGTNEEPHINQQESIGGRQKRQKAQPKHLSDYQVKLPPSINHMQPTSNQESSTVHPLSHYVSFEHFSNTHKAFLSAINTHDEPKSFHQAAQDENWKEAMQKEIHALEQNGMWTLEQLPEGKKAIDSRWVY